MPITTERLQVKKRKGDWCDKFKWNRLSSQLSNTDCVLQEFVKSRKIHIGALAFGAARTVGVYCKGGDQCGGKCLPNRASYASFFGAALAIVGVV